MTHPWLAIVTGTLLLSSATQDPHRPSDKLDLAGHWAVNAGMSDPLPLLPGEAMSIARAAGVVRTGARPSRAASGPDARLVSTVRSALRKSLRAMSELRIAQRGSTVIFTDADDQSLALVPGAREQALQHQELRVVVAATWEAPLFTVTREYADGTIVTDSYSSFTAPRQLVAISTISNRHMAEKPVVINRVYDSLDR